MTHLAVFLGKLVSLISKTFRLGAGATWPGEIALKLDPEILRKIAPKNIILIAGTNGKTTTALMVKTILENNGKSVVHNVSGANLINGVVSAIITAPKADWGVFEVDENSLPQIIKFIKGIKAIVLLNLFRDQLDRYGEVDTIAKKWFQALSTVSCTYIINGDDPQLAWLGQKLTNTYFFGLGDKKYFLPKVQHATDSIYCPNCGTRLQFSGHYFSHLGTWQCPKCKFSSPKLSLEAKDVTSPLEGIYSIYNTLAASLVAQKLNLKPDFTGFSAAFGRQEEIADKKILLSKNPTGFNESLRTVLDSKKKGPILLLLNDRIPDGRDVSWIWDVDFEVLKRYPYPIYVSGDRKYDLALRLKYAEVPIEIREETGNVSWILATYTAMLDIRKKLLGRKIL